MRRTVRTRVRRFDENGLVDARADSLAGEEPLEVRLDGEQFTVTMRTPGDDVELIAGFLLSEGIVTDWEQILRVDFSAGIDPDGTRNLNVARVNLEPGTWDRDLYQARQIYTSSACGICGTASIEAVQRTTTHPIVLDAMSDDGPVAGPVITAKALLQLPDLLREEQKLFGSTGGVHAAGLFRMVRDTEDRADETGPVGVADRVEMLAVREDVGRHNAVDKVIGWAMQEGLLPLSDTVLQVSGRASFELVQKAAMAGIPVLSAVSAPSGLAVDLGREQGITVVGFNRGKGLNAYSHHERVV
ncbi:formate dehydrogenase accessory sulfurtransferase FdhD [Brevibacterium yomogidense]|uniref:formate dehydrogenase accessory sulfurtransferase FdhD n=1 Tax=Brevibacterium yomogidense TaxID=946573 RepID=UPI0018DF15C7|nr:formate dehydrogenase accessory sulfurtransferase FdhD [Brevibacterium yomogidense]